MKLSALIAARPIYVLVFLALVILLLPSLVISFWYKITRRLEGNVDSNTQNLCSGLLSEVGIIANLVQPLNSSTTNLARLCSSSINQTEIISFNEIETKVAPVLFQAFSTIPYVSQISYVGLGGLFFSYYIDGNQTMSMYSNSSFSSYSTGPKGPKQHVYKQLVDNYSGKLYGETVRSHYLNFVNTSWFQAALVNDSKGFSSVEKGWNSAGDPVFLNSASVNGKAVVSIAFSVKTITDILGGINLYGGSLSLATKDGKMLVDRIPNTQIIISADNSISLQLVKPNDANYAQNVACLPRNETSAAFVLDIGDEEYSVYCSSLEISGVQLVYAVTFPHKGLVSLVQRNTRLSLVLLIVMIVMVMISIFSFVLLMIRTVEREMCLYAKLIKQMDATQQAERKSINKSLALANASHDIRASLAGITGLIDLCLTDAAPRSEFAAYLKQMQNCAQDLLGLLNSILDTSKIEAGMMNLDEEEFNLAELLEHVVDLYHPVGMRKGVDVVLDPCDGSVIKFSKVKGDRAKLMQILSNILSNAVKFTPEGHVSLRAWVQKPNFESRILASGQNGLHKYLSCMFRNNNGAQNDMEVISAVRQNPDTMEFVFEVDDTGKGIPKEKQKSVFENFVQVKETAAGQVGTGLGLGIVQSLVRLMGGEIGIVDKEIGEKGTCFRFNVFLVAVETSIIDNTKGEKEIQGDSPSGGTQHNSRLTILTPNPNLTIRNSSPRLAFCAHSPKLEGSQVVLLIQNDERRRISQKFMESLGINVLVLDQWESLHPALKKMKSKLISSQHSSRRHDLSSKSDISSSSSKDMPLNAMDGADKLPFKIQKGAPSFILLVIDASAGPPSELWRAVDEFRSGLQSIRCKVVWLDKLTTHSIGSISLEKERLDPDDEILLQPFHGSRLFQVIKLLPEFGGNLSQGVSTDPESSSMAKRSRVEARSRNLHQNEEIQEDGSSSDDRYRKKDLSFSLPSTFPPFHQPEQTELKKDHAESSSKQPLNGKRILIAEDNAMLSHLAGAIVRRLGAQVEHCENGEEAVQLVRNGLKDETNNEGHNIPYDYVLMDCEMPLMNGYEATRQIRDVEKHYGVHIPIIALTAHTSGVETSKTIEAGMDIHLGKPLLAKDLLEAIEKVHSRGKMF